ncbi:MAG: hypothetical protein L0Z51_00905 [Candidatus Latescibacteria bacterium]|nr:hypothetical protein [Candidatus Latescibacterota bacterium]
MVEAANEVLTSRGIFEQVTMADMSFLARQGHAVASASGFSFAKMSGDAHLRLIEFLHETERVSDVEANELYALAARPVEGVAIEESLQDGGEPGSPGKSIVATYKQVAFASFDLWAELVPRQPEPRTRRTVQREFFELDL